MSQEPTNPFALPGMSAAFMNPATNPLLTSMDMMRQAMGSLGANQGVQATTGYPLSGEELEKRIADLRVVENWLKLNLSMLSSTIQGLEVQAATIKTLQSFAAMGSAVSQGATATPSPLEAVLGIKPAQPPTSESVKSEPASQPSQDAEPPTSEQSDPKQAAAQGWWQMLENQFAQIAAATQQAAKVGQQTMSAANKKESSAKKTAAPVRRRTARKATKTVVRNKKTD